MGFINWIMQWDMRREARRIAKIVAEKYPVVKTQNPDFTETEVIKKLFFDNEKMSQIPKESRNHIEICCSSIEGLCYMLAFDIGRMKGLMKFRCLQFTKYMDAELYSQGFKPQSRETKEAILDELALLIDRWEKWC